MNHCYAQYIPVATLVQLQGQDSATVAAFMNKEGWHFYANDTATTTSLATIQWNYRNDTLPQPAAWLKYSYGGLVTKRIIYATQDRSVFLKMQHEITNAGYRKIDSKTTSNAIVTAYRMNGITIIVTSPGNTAGAKNISATYFFEVWDNWDYNDVH